MSGQNNNVTEAAPMAKKKARTQNKFAARVPLIPGTWRMNLNHLPPIALFQKPAWSWKA